jgi:hypothetical protein
MVAADICQQFGGVLVDVQLAEMAQHRHQFTQNRRQPLAGRHPQHRPADRQCRNDIGPILHRGPRTSPRGHDLGLQRSLERLAGMVSVPAGVGAQLVENPALTALAWPPPLVADRGRLGDCPALGQRQPHLLGLPWRAQNRAAAAALMRQSASCSAYRMARCSDTEDWAVDTEAAVSAEVAAALANKPRPGGEPVTLCPGDARTAAEAGRSLPSR